MKNKYLEALYENNWYKVNKIDYEYQVVYLKTGNGCAKIHMCYIDEIKEIKGEVNVKKSNVNI